MTKKAKIIIKTFLLITALVFIFSACSDTANTYDGSTNDFSNIINSNNKKPNGKPAPPQPIIFDSIDDAIGFIKNPDLNDYTEEFCNAYLKMVATFQNDGYITTVTHSSATKFDETVALYPEAKYEDIGVHYYFRFNEILYQVIIFNVKSGEDYSVDLQTETVMDYRNKRYGISPANFDIEDTDNSSIPSIALFMNQNILFAESLLDESHYIVIRPKSEDVTASEMISFINGLILTHTDIE